MAAQARVVCPIGPHSVVTDGAGGHLVLDAFCTAAAKTWLRLSVMCDGNGGRCVNILVQSVPLAQSFTNIC